MDRRRRQNLPELFAQAAHFGKADGVDGSYPDRTLRGIPDFFECRGEILGAPEYVPAQIRVELSRRREAQGPRGAVEQFRAEAFLQILNLLCRG